MVSRHIQGIQAKSGRTSISSPNRVSYQLLDNAFNGFVKRILWLHVENGRLNGINQVQKDSIAEALTALIELSEEALLHEITPEMWVKFIRQSANSIDAANRTLENEKRDIPQ